MFKKNVYDNDFQFGIIQLKRLFVFGTDGRVTGKKELGGAGRGGIRLGDFVLFP